ncbi:MAG: diguanylate cyclase/phosphodiesterase with sensor(s) [Ilumatobacteraceae bacterium]|nr:diguanylate cyclase/phosphodiesterase with sensor(s) [Ilumatobacteraceae bacterium]
MSTPPDHLEPLRAVRRASMVSRAFVRSAVDEANTDALSIGVIHLDMDRFHQVNQRWGQQLGDQVLEAIGRRLLACLPNGSLLSATEGDSFVAVVPSDGFGTTKACAEALLDAVRVPIGSGDLTVALDSLIGIVQSGPTERGQMRVTLDASAGFATHLPTDLPSDLLEQAFLACRQAKATMRGAAIGYELGLGADDVRRQRTEEGLRTAIVDGELRLHVQPTIDLRDGRMIGVEALVRWQHPIDGLLSPADFLPMAEVAGLMTAIGDWVLDEAIRLSQHWRQIRGGESLRIWVNLAAQQLADGEHLYSRVRTAMEAGLISANDIGFEVTESSLLEDLPSAVGALSALRALGFEIALDDFGTGYSSLTYLRQLPVTAVKIDRSFVSGIGGSLADEAIVEAVIDLAHALGLRVIAEGIEDLDQADALVRMGADEAQGFYFGFPEPSGAVEPKLSIPWCGVQPPRQSGSRTSDRRADELPGFGSARARLLLTALDTVHDSIVVTTAASGRAGSPPIVYVNPSFEAETGFRSRDVVGHTIEFLLADSADPDELGWLHGENADVLSTTGEVASRRADGSTFLCDVTRSPIFDERGIHTHWLHVRRDLTLRRAAEHHSARFQGLIEQSGSLVAIAETGGAWVYANAAQRAAIGIGADEPLDQLHDLQMYTPGHRQTVLDVIIPALRDHGRWSGEAEFVNDVTGVVTEVVTDIHVVDDPLRPGVKVYASVSRDMTEVNAFERTERRRRELSTMAAEIAQRALSRGRDELFADLDDVLGECGALLHADVTYVDAIDTAGGVLRPLGTWSSARCPARPTPPDVVDLAHVPHWIDRLRLPGVLVGESVAEHGAPWRHELARIFSEQPFGSNVYAALHVGGELVGVFGLARLDSEPAWTEDEVVTVQQIADTLANLLGRELSDRARQAGETHVRAMLDNVRDILVVLDRNGWIVSSNQSIEAALGFTPDSIVGTHFLTLVHPDDQDLALTRFAETLAGAEGLLVTEIRLLTADGGAEWFDVDASGAEDPILGGYVVSLRNMSFQRAMLDAVGRQSEFERMLLGLSHWALNVQHEEIGDGLAGQIEHLGRILHADAAGVWLVDGATVRRGGQWLDEGCIATASPFDAFDAPLLTSRLRDVDGAVVVNDIDTIDAKWADEWRRIDGHGRSALLVPLVSAGTCLGLAGVMMKKSARTWADDEVALTRRVADTVSALLGRQRVESSLRMSEARLSALLDESLDLVVVVTDEGDILYANRALQRALGYSPRDVLGTSIAAVVHADDLHLAADGLAKLAAGVANEAITLRVVGSDGSIRWLEVMSGQIRNPIAGGKVLTCRDVTERHAAEAAAAARVSHLRYAFEVAQAALDLDPEAFLEELRKVCETVAEMLEVDLIYVDRIDEQSMLLTNIAGHTTMNDAIQLVNPGQTMPFTQLPRWVERLRRLDPVMITDARECGEDWAIEKRECLGSEAGLMAVAMSAAGELFGVLGVSMVSTPREWTEDELTFLRIIGETVAHVLEKARVDDALRRSETRFRLLSETAADVVLLIDAAGIIQYASPSSQSLLGYSPDELRGLSTTAIVHPEHIGLITNVGQMELQSGRPITSECLLLRADGSAVWVANSISAVVDRETGLVVEYRASVRDVTDRKRLEAALEQQALHDPLTGLGNRILLQQRLTDATTSGPGSAEQVAVLLVDLDGFKLVNDTYGHAVGDDVLRIISSRLAALTRHGDTLARTGGDEFVVICPRTSTEAAVRIGERIVKAVRQPLSTGGMVLHVGASVGVAHHVGGTPDPGWLLIDADHAMYAAKREGRGRVRVASSSAHASSPVGITA